MMRTLARSALLALLAVVVLLGSAGVAGAAAPGAPDSPDAPAVEAPAPEAPAVEAPAPEAPSVEAPGPDAAAVEAPAPEAPAPAVVAPALDAPAPAVVAPPVTDRVAIAEGPVIVEDPPPATLDVDPDTDLADGQVVHFHGTGFPADRTISVGVCPCFRGPSGLAVQSDGNGVIDGRLRVTRTPFALGPPIDCLTTACSVVAQSSAEDFGHPQVVAQHSITFDPDAPPAEEPTLDAAPRSGLHEGTTVIVSGAHHQVDSAVGTLYQCLPGVGCDFSNMANAASDANGDVRVSFVVRRSLLIEGVEHDCDTAPGQCVLSIGAKAFPLTFTTPRESVTVSPTTGLTDGSTITVTATNFESNRFVMAQICSVPARDAAHCEDGAPFAYDRTLDGGWVKQGTTPRVISTPSGDVDCSVYSCYVVAGDVANTRLTWIYGLQFAPATPGGGTTDPPPPPTDGGTPAAPAGATSVNTPRAISRATLPVTGGGSTSLPLTGLDPSPWLWSGLLAIAAGVALGAWSRHERRSRAR
jgi:hypothetical protein